MIRKKKNSFLSLTRDDGSISWDQDEIASSIHSYFKNIYSYSNNSSSSPPSLNTLPSLTNAQKDSLSNLPTDLEIKSACFDLHPLKTPGEDGLHAIFYHKNWITIKDQIITLINNIFKTGIVPSSWGNTLLCLIPKIKTASKPSHLRPIGLCLTHYKILSKLLTNCLKPFLPNLISPFQGAF